MLERLLCLVAIALAPCLTNAQTLGADLNYQVDKEGELTITLTCYSVCAEIEVQPVDHVMIIETMAPGQKVFVQLDLVNTEQAPTQNSAPCKGLLDCVEARRYEGSTKLNPVPGGYDLVWSFEMIDGHTTNTIAQQKLALNAHVEEVAIIEGNQSPVFLNPPMFKGCANHENMTTHLLVDTLDTDSIRSSFSAVASLQPKSDLSTPGQMAPPGMPAIPYPPYLPVVFQDGFSPDSPYGKSSTIDTSQEGILKITPQLTGRFLIGITVEDQRNGVLLGRTQRIFITEII